MKSANSFRSALAVALLVSILGLGSYASGARVPSIDARTSQLDSFIYLPIIDSNYCASLYKDDFSNPSTGWLVADAGIIQWSYQDGQYEIVLRGENLLAGAPAPTRVLTQYSVEADMRRYSGSTSQYALVFDLVDLNHFYLFIVDPGSRYYAVARRDSSDWFVVVPWAASPYINSTNATNHLKVERYGAQITVSINNHLLTIATDNAYTNADGLKVGLFAQTGGDVPAAVRFDNFEVCGAVASNLGDAITTRPSNETWAAGNPLVVNAHHDATPAR